MENKLDWANLGSLTGEFSEKIIVDVLPLENRIFFNTKENWYELDIEQNSTRKIEELSSFAYRPYDLLFEGSGFVYENKFYIWKQLKETGYILLEFDPTYF